MNGWALHPTEIVRQVLERHPDLKNASLRLEPPDLVYFIAARSGAMQCLPVYRHEVGLWTDAHIAAYLIGCLNPKAPATP